ncbi:hypothetical protein YPPY32_0968, partial [Yersinia pestis PY-32]
MIRVNGTATAPLMQTGLQLQVRKVSYLSRLVALAPSPANAASRSKITLSFSGLRLP